MRKAWFLLILAACGRADDNASSGGGNNVSFGGAQDIGQFKSILAEGGVPLPDSLDANGFFNEHYSTPAPADCGQALCVTPSLFVGHDWLTGAAQTTIELRIATTVDNPTRLPMNLVLVIDRSGSMSEDGRLDKVKAGVAKLIDNLADGDRLAIVDFDDQVTVDSELTTDRDALKAKAAELFPRGGTDIDAGLRTGFSLLGDAPRDHQNRVILMSDGLATSGVTDDYTILANADAHVESGIELSTIGVGDDFDPALMRGLAEHGAGNFYFLEDAAAIDEVFTQELDYFLTPIATDLDIAMTAGKGWTLTDVVGSNLWQNGKLHIPAVFLASRTSSNPDPGRRGGGSRLFIHATGEGAQVATFDVTFKTDGTQAQHVTLAASDASDVYGADLAVYNLYLGLRFATEAGAPCATPVLRALRTAAVAWNEQNASADADLTDDLSLIDQFLHNVATSDNGQTLDTCAADKPYEDPAYGYEPMPCSAGGKPSGLAPLLLAFALLRRRRLRV